MSTGGTAAAADEAERVLCMAFNQDHSYFTVGTTRGFRVYAADPFRLRFGKGLPHASHATPAKRHHRDEKQSNQHTRNQ